MTVAEKTEATVTPRKPTTLKTSENERVVYVHYVEAGVHPHALLKPDFWTHVAAKLRSGDRIEVTAEDLSYFAELMVLQADRTWAKVSMLRLHELTGEDPTADDMRTIGSEYRIQFKGPAKKHCVFRVKDGQLVAEGIAMKGDAERWIAEHVQALAK
jgi:hypothetical protein